MFRDSYLVLLHAITNYNLVIGKTICEDQSCATSMAKIVEQEQHEIEGARLGLLQGRAKPMFNGVDPLTPVDKTRKSTQLPGCPRIDARKLSPAELKQIRVPTILEHALEIHDDTTWAFSDFKADGPFGNITTVDYGLKPYPSDCAREADGVPFPTLPLHERLDEGTGILRLRQCVDGVEEIVASISEKNEGVPESPYSIFSEEVMTKEYLVITLANTRMWSPAHSHAETLFTQVSGSKGWLFGDPKAADEEMVYNRIDESTNITGEKHPTIQVLPYVDLDGNGICGVFFEDTLPESVAQRRQHFRACETHPGEAIYWPGFCDGHCGWWHGGCGLEWSAGIARIGFANPEDKLSRF